MPFYYYMEYTFITSALLHIIGGLVTNYEKKTSVRIAVTEFDPEIFQILTYSGDLKHTILLLQQGLYYLLTILSFCDHIHTNALMLFDDLRPPIHKA
jgi:hypothetical protein